MLMSEESQRSQVFRSITHYDFDSDNLKNNIGLLMLAAQIIFSSNILPICLPQFGIVLEGPGTAIGFGQSSGSSSDVMTLQEVQVPIAEDDVCFASDNEFYEKYLDKQSFCGGTKEKGANVCGGDRGKFWDFHDIFLQIILFFLFRWWVVYQERKSLDIEGHYIDCSDNSWLSKSNM